MVEAGGNSCNLEMHGRGKELLQPRDAWQRQGTLTTSRCMVEAGGNSYNLEMHRRGRELLQPRDARQRRGTRAAGGARVPPVVFSAARGPPAGSGQLDMPSKRA